MKPNQAIKYYPLSSPQREIWFDQMLHPDVPLYNIGGYIKINGAIVPALFESAINLLVQNNDALRSVFIKGKSEMPMQTLLEEIQVDMPFYDFSWKSNPGQSALDWMEGQFVVPFELNGADLKNSPLFRFALLKISDNHFHLWFVYHHLIVDGWGISLINKRLGTIYSGLLQGQKTNLTSNLDYPSYLDFIKHDQKYIESSRYNDDLQYWIEKYKNLPEPLFKQHYLSKVAGHTPDGKRKVLWLERPFYNRLLSFAEKTSSTPFHVILGVLYVYFTRTSQKEELAIGLPILNRSKASFKETVGLFIGVCAMRFQFGTKLSFGELLKTIDKTLKADYRHQRLPISDLYREINFQEMGQRQLFDIQLNYAKHDHDTEFEGVFKPRANNIGQIPLSISIWEFHENEDVQVDFVYNLAYFNSADIKRLQSRFMLILEYVLNHVDESISTIPLMPEVEKQQLLALNQAESNYPKEQTIIDLFQDQVTKTPDNIAVAFENQQLSYQELNRKTNQLAHYLINLGVGTETLVGICVERSLELVIGLLAILKAGGAYIPLDPDYPQERLQFMLEDSSVTTLLSQSHLQERLPSSDPQPKMFFLDSQWQQIANYSDENPVKQSGPENLAYVIYTSGSTGKPKGCQVTHYNVTRLFTTTESLFHFDHHDVWTMFHSYAFDFSVWEIWGALLYGGKLVVVPYFTSRAPDGFYQLLINEGVTILNQTPSAFKQLLNVDNKPNELSLRVVIFGGEAMDFNMLQQWFDHHDDKNTQLVNMYGITETTVHVTWYQLNKEDACGKSLIGIPLPDLKVWVLDSLHQPVPIGVPGEMYVGGPGVTRGYLNRPELTESRFIEIKLFGNTERLYKTGDLARWLPGHNTNGYNLEYLGRIDQQVKIRGFRIELGEIEAVLCQQDAIKEAVVVLYNQDDNPRLIAYVTTSMPINDPAGVLRTWLKEQLPEYMLPTGFVILDKLPLTPNGKINRKVLPNPDVTQIQNKANFIKPQTILEQQIAEIWQDLLKLEKVGVHDNFFDLGGHSLLLIQAQGLLKALVKEPLPTVKLFQYPTINSLASYLTKNKPKERASLDIKREDDSCDIAIIGLAGRFPGAKNIENFWNNLREGVESIQFFSDNELLETGVDPVLLNNPDYVKANGVLENVDLFDAKFFGYSPKEAAILDPQLRLFLEIAWAAIEHASYDAERINFKVGIFAGAGTSSYFINNLLTNQNLKESLGSYQLMLGDKEFIASRTAYRLNLKGPALFIHTACSTSLVAVHLACQSLLNSECHMALAGGVTVSIPQTQGYLYQEDMIASPDGHCRAFDASAQGTVGGSGAGVVVLKRLSNALADGDTIHTIIKGTAINNDGMDKVGFTAPSVEGQAEVIKEAMQGIDYESISYIEAHGTGTVLGDPIEVSALTQAYGEHTEKRGYCALGSVKTNVGHLDAAAGITGLIKTVLALKHREIPPSLHFKNPNPQIDFANTPFFVNAELRPWQSPTPLRAGVSSFGIGGTNAHVVVEEAVSPQQSTICNNWKIVCLAAKTETALRQLSNNLSDYLFTHQELNMADIAYTLNVGRKEFTHRGFLIGKDLSEVAEVLRQQNPKEWRRGHTDDKEPQVIFMFPGQGTQYLKMAHGLYKEIPLFKITIDECVQLLKPHLGLDLRKLLYHESTESDLEQTIYAQPAIFITEYALARVCIAWGIEPIAMIGHSIGEYVAACLAGVFSLSDALELIVVRAKLMQAQPKGEMLSISLNRDEVEVLLTADLSIAAFNAPNQCVISGPKTAINTLIEKLENQQIEYCYLQTSHAFHSSMMNPMLPTFCEHLQSISLHPPQRPYISNLTGTWITPEQATSIDYWSQHLLNTVRFSEGIQTLLTLQEQVPCLFLELGPGRALSTLTRLHNQNQIVFNTLRPATKEQDDHVFLLNTLGQMWLKNVKLDWPAFYSNKDCLRIPLPTYPFEGKRYWINPIPLAQASQTDNVDKPDELNETSLPTLHNRPDVTTRYVAPRTTMELQIALIWQLLLGIEPIGIYDDFFELGGHSLLGTQVLSRLREKFSLEISLDVLFGNPVLEELAKHLEKQQCQTELPPITPLSEGEPLVWSFAQQRMWFLAQLDGQSATYNLPAVLQLFGQLNETALQRALTVLTERHNSLRLKFPLVDGKATVKLIEVYNPLSITDLSGLSEAEQQPQITEWITKHSQTPFDLSTGPLLNLRLIKLSDKEQILLFNIHHIISDGWSMGVLIQEWSHLYNAYAQNLEHPDKQLPKPKIQYTDYAAWQKEWLQGKVLEDQLTYWTKKLAGAPELLEIHTDYTRPLVISYQGKHLKSILDHNTTAGIQQISQKHGVTDFMTLLAAFKVLLYRHSGQTDLLVGSPIANRTHHQTEDLIGLFVNTLVLRTQIKGEQTFPELLKVVRQTALEAYNHQDIPFEYLVEQINPTRSLSHSPLFQVMFVLQNAPRVELELVNLKTTFREPENTTAQFDLTLSIAEKGKIFACDWEYNTDLFHPDTITAMAKHFQILLEGILNNPEQSLFQLPMLTETERKQLLDLNQTETYYPTTQTIVDMFQAQVEKRPDNIAVVFEDQQLSYYELNRKANQLAHYLINLKSETNNCVLLTTNSLIGLCVERSLDMAVGLLGILKAGVAYVPLDPDYPLSRLQFMLEDSAAPVLLSQSHLLEKLSVLKSKVVCLDNEREQIEACSEENPIRQSNLNDLAYVIYTSGSTGKPKGVMVEHIAVAQHINYSITRYQIETSDKILQFASLNFDASIEQIFSAWCGGAGLILLRSNLISAEAILNIIVKEQITIADLPPAYWQQILNESNKQNIKTLKLLILGGEPVFSQIALQSRQFLSKDVTILNAYGPTEATITTTLFEVTDEFQDTCIKKITPIGLPVANTLIYILDSNDNLTPPGIPGELCIAGEGLAKGYLNRPELTGAKFMEIEVFGKTQRLYKSGDLARWLPNGNLEYLGRLDHQVKVRGFRIELGEIESILCQQNSVKEAVVVLYDKSDNPCLVAYITLINNQTPAVSDPLAKGDEQISLIPELRTWLKDRLPEYMLPTSFTILDELPLTPNGKVNRKVLPEPDFTIQPKVLKAPRTETEHLLCIIWSQVLRIEVTSIDSNFFEIGGHSLLATQLVSRIREGFSIEIPMRVIFEKPILMEQTEWLDKQQRGSGLPQINPLPEGAPLVLSFAQQRLWFLAQLEGENATYNMPAALQLSGQLNETALQKALIALVQRHKSLCLCFPTVNGEATVQLNNVYNPLSIADLTHLRNLPKSEQQNQVNDLIAKHAQTPFNLSTGPLLNLHLIKLDNEEHILLFNMHHIISDGWSISVLIREWRELYNAYNQNQELQLSLLPIQYTDYAAWQRNWLEQGALENQLAYWKVKLSGIPELLELPTDYPRPAMMHYEGKHLQSTLDQELMQGIKQMSQKEAATIFMTLLATFNVLLFRYTGQADIVIGSPIANRTHHQTEDLIGFFVNTLVLRTPIKGEQTFLELLKQVRQTSLEAYTHQDIPFEYLVVDVNLTRCMSHSPLFQVMFILQNTPEEELELGGLKMTLMEPENRAAKFDLTLSISETLNGFVCNWEYNTDLFHSDTITRMSEHFQILLKGIINNPELPVSQLPLLTASEKQQLLAWNHTEMDSPKEQTIVDLFQTQVEKTPDNIAVVFEDRQLSYRELNKAANQLANYLMSLEVKTETLVGICMERSLEMMIGLLGILKAGGAYVPLDPDYPEERLKFMLEDSSVAVLLSQNHLLERLPKNVNKIVCLDSEWEQVAKYSEDNPTRQSNLDNLAYMIYTSGSTGVPKAVMIEHKAFINFLSYMQQRIEITSNDKLLAITTLSFDIAALELYLPLITGSQTIIISREIASNGEILKQKLAEHQITIMQATPATWKLLIQSSWSQLTPLTILCGGEALSKSLGQALLKNSQQLWNVYGPTETTIWSSIHDVTLQPERPELIGKPIGNTQIYILDRNNNNTPSGVPGELCIAGLGLARGYFNRSELTASKFIEINVFGKTQRLYKTGDLARWLSNGNLEYLGRLDHQVKVRGFRIELGEIETTLCQHNSVNEAVVVLYNKDDNPRLVAYITLINNQIPLVNDNSSLVTELRAWMKTRLPEYMLPASFTILDELPLTPNGKINRKVLPEPDFTTKSGQSKSPRTETEHLLCVLWSQVLKTEITSIKNNFFETGGHSLLATQLASRIREGFGIEIPIRIIFEKPILMEQASWLEKQQRGSELPQIRPLPEDSPMILSFAQQRLWFLVQLEEKSAIYNMPAALHIFGQLNETALQQALTTLVQRHKSLRLCFPMVNGEATVQLNEVYNPLSVTDLTHLKNLPESEQQNQIDELRSKHAQTYFNVSTGPLLNLHLIKLSKEDHVLLFNMHHIISDAWSMGVLIREWKELYNSSDQKQKSQLPTPPIQYTDYAAWQRNWLEQRTLDSQFAYWKDKLNGIPELLELPTDHTRPAMMSYQGQHLQSFLDQELVKEIKQISQQHSATVFMTLLTAFNILLYRYSGQADLVVGSPIANRTHHQTEDLIGFFMNTLVLRTQIKEKQTFPELLKQVRQTSVEAYTHQDIPFEYLVEKINPTRSMSHSPLFQVMFILQNAPEEVLELGGLKMSFMEPINKTAKFDLTLSIEENKNGFVCDWEYSTDLFHSDTITRMSEHFQLLLKGIINNPGLPASQLPLLTESEKQQLLAWNQTEMDYPKEKTIVDLFQTQVEKTPNNIAVAFADQQLSYQELNRKANQLAHYLMSLGIGAEMLVGICVERSLEMVVGLLGILKAGAAYVPLDPDYPEERLKFMLEDSSVAVLLSQSNLLERLPENLSKIVCLDSNWKQIVEYSEDNPVKQSGPDNLGYMIYTSGSTGVPKAVMIEHRAFINFLSYMQQRIEITSNDKLLAITTLSFDIAVLELYLPLITGSQTVIIGREIASNGEILKQKLSEYQITIMQATPATWKLLIQSGWNQLTPLTILCGGEPLSNQLGQTLLNNSQQLWNVYGPTETTIWSSIHNVTKYKEKPEWIGKPIGNTQIYILDKNYKPTPTGIPGELCIAGVGLARGYFNHTELTDEKFIEVELFGQKQRIYKTGDLARWLQNGNIEYLGRLDFQVKVRGFRIELGEIEALLHKHDAVKEAVVTLYNKNDNPRLITYITLTSNHSTMITDQPSVDSDKLSKDSEQTLNNETFDHTSLIIELRAWLKVRLPEYMTPDSFIVLEKLPLTPNGKIDRKALPNPDATLIQDNTHFIKPQTTLEQRIAQIWQEILKREKIGINDNFFDLGGHSSLLLQVQSRLQTFVEEPLPVVKLFQYPTIQTLATYLAHNEPKQADHIVHIKDESSDIAIIGMAGRFPGAKNIDTFWNNLREGVESIHFFNDNELLESGVDPNLLNNPDYVKAGGLLENPELFDALFFGYSPKEAEIIDPQQRLFLEIAWEGMEHAGYNVEKLNMPVGVFAGAGINTYLINNLLPNKKMLETHDNYEIMLGSSNDFIATRTAYKLNLKGQSLTIQTACSTSLVAVNMACQSLLSNTCHMALAGGVSVSFPQTQGYLYQEGMIASPDGHCRAFDASACGTVDGSGAGVVVLKRLSQAKADGDTIHAVIKGFAVNNDGMNKVGFTAPGLEGQSTVIKEAMQGLDYESISYVEAHGTGTILGDPIEVSALTEAYGTHTKKIGYCALGSVKTNVGHLDAAAGIAGLIKTVLALKHSEIPASLHFENPNPKIVFSDTPFFVNTKLRPWKSSTTPLPLRAGVSSFGIGGTNAHVVVEEAVSNMQSASNNNRQWTIICLSAKTDSALRQYGNNLADYLSKNRDLNIANTAYTLNVGRKEFTYRGFLIGRDLSEIVETLQQNNSKQWYQSKTNDKAPEIVFMFPGQGAQYINMAQGLYKDEPLFKSIIDECAQLLKPYLGVDLRDRLYQEADELDLEQTIYAQPALFVTEYALAKLCLDWGIEPVAMIGHSIGEYVAACMAEVFSLQDALRLVAERAKLMQAQPKGKMISISLPKSKVEPLLNSELSIAAHNAPNLCVVSGTKIEVNRLIEKLGKQKIEHRILHTSHAFHSSMMNPMVPDFRKQLQKISLNPPQRPYISNLTGTWITPEQATSVDYWIQHLTNTVRFSEGIQTLLEQAPYILLELGPGRVLSTLARQHNQQLPIFNALRPAGTKQADCAFLLNTIGQLWLKSVNLNWKAFYANNQCLRIPLPTYPFEGQRYWIDPITPTKQTQIVKRPIDEWFYVPQWKSTTSLVLQPDTKPLNISKWLIFSDNLGLGDELEQTLEKQAQIIKVQSGKTFEQHNLQNYTINPNQRDDYEKLFIALEKSGQAPDAVLHLWCLDITNDLDENQVNGFYSLLFLAQTWPKLKNEQDRYLFVLTNQIHAITKVENLNAITATILGPVQTIGSEYPDIHCRSIDIESNIRQLVKPLLEECQAINTERIIAFRNGQRWVRTFEPIYLPAANSESTNLRCQGVYLITGGLGGIGLSLAAYLAEKAQARLILIGRSVLPEKQTWDDWLDAHDDNETTSIKIRRIRELQALGAEVLVIHADISDREQMQSAIEQAKAQFGTIHGVIHAAGTLRNEIIELKTVTEAKQVLSPKVEGSIVLNQLLEAQQLDFLIFCSSLNAMMEIHGRVDYCSANAFLDAYAHVLYTQGINAISINWDGWQEVGMAANTQETTNNAELLDNNSIKPFEGVEAFALILSHPIPQILLSTTDWQQRLQLQNADLEFQKKEWIQKSTETVLHNRPALTTEYVATRTLVEQQLADIWQLLLGIEPIGIYDDFFELGGHSLLMIQLISRLHETFSVKLPMETLFELPTIARLSEEIEEIQSMRKQLQTSTSQLPYKVEEIEF